MSLLATSRRNESIVSGPVVVCEVGSHWNSIGLMVSSLVSVVDSRMLVVVSVAVPVGIEF